MQISGADYGPAVPSGVFVCAPSPRLSVPQAEEGSGRSATESQAIRRMSPVRWCRWRSSCSPRPCRSPGRSCWPGSSAASRWRSGATHPSAGRGRRRSRSLSACAGRCCRSRRSPRPARTARASPRRPRSGATAEAGRRHRHARGPGLGAASRAGRPAPGPAAADAGALGRALVDRRLPGRSPARTCSGSRRSGSKS